MKTNKFFSGLFLTVSMLFLLSACGGDGGTPDFSDVLDTPNPNPVTVADIAKATPDFSILAAALEATGLDDVLDDESATYTVFAPTNAAFEALGMETINDLLAQPEVLSNILLYHVVGGAAIDADAAIASAGGTVSMANDNVVAVSLSGSQLYINLSQVIDPDVAADNGIIHVIDAVLMPPAEAAEPTANIVETAQAAGSFNTLLTALGAAGLDDVLADENETFTVFAPTDDAFALIPEELLAAIIAEPETLSAILLQHVISGAAVDSITAMTLNGAQAETASQALIDIEIVDGVLYVGGSRVVTTDIRTTNGIIHVIDAVIVGDVALPVLPTTISDIVQSNPDFSTLLAALQATNLVDTLDDVSTNFTVFAPTNAAFEALGEDTLNALLANPTQLSNILLYHVIAGSEIDSTAAVAAAGNTVEMANESLAAVSYVEPTVFINLSEVVEADVQADNGVIHVIDAVMLPPADMGEPTLNIVETAVAGGFDTLVAAVTAAGLVDYLSNPDANLTVFAPTDEAFAAIPTDTLNAIIADVPLLTQLLQLHVIDGAAVDAVTAMTLNGGEAETAGGAMVDIMIMDGALYVGGARVETTDIYTTNGIIHVIDAVIVGDLELP